MKVNERAVVRVREESGALASGAMAADSTVP